MGDMYSLWLTVQKELAKVERWGSYRVRNPKLRKQSTLQHQFSICLVIMPILFKLKEYYFILDTELLKDAFLLHDIPEGLLRMKKDVQSNAKKDHHDFSEYMAFENHFSHLEKKVYNHLLRIYLLQFAHKSNEALALFPQEALEIIIDLRRRNPIEVALFPALEHWEYLFYAYECYLDKKDDVIFVNVLRSQVPRLQKHAEDIRGFRDVLFPKCFEDRLVEFINERHSVLVC